MLARYGGQGPSGPTPHTTVRDRGQVAADSARIRLRKRATEEKPVRAAHDAEQRTIYLNKGIAPPW